MKVSNLANSRKNYYYSRIVSISILNVTHNFVIVERRRKDKINSWITKLAEVIPKCAYGKQV